MRGNIRRLIATGIACLAVSAAMATPALSADDEQVTRGRLRVFAAGATIERYAGINGKVVMERDDDETTVWLKVSGLDPNTAYPAHVHKLPCGVSNAGGHYMRDPSGQPFPPNEIWPEFTTNAHGKGKAEVEASFRAGPDAVSVVIHDWAGTKPKIACADLA